MDDKIQKNLEIAFDKIGEAAEAFEEAGFDQVACLLYAFASKSLIEFKDSENKLDAKTYDETLSKIFEMEI